MRLQERNFMFSRDHLLQRQKQYTELVYIFRRNMFGTAWAPMIDPLIGVSLLALTLLVQGGEIHKEYPPYDGWYNNRAHPDWGVVDKPLSRRVPSHYQDGVYMPSGWDRPNPRTVSQELMKGKTGIGSFGNKTALMVFFGQQIVEEILDAQRPGCPPEYFNIAIPKDDELYDQEGTGTVAIPFVRSRYEQAVTGFSPNSPREQMNEITPYLDGGVTYGINKAWADALRLHGHCETRRANSNIFSTTRPDGEQDCRGELASLNDEGRLPPLNDIGLPLENPPPPRDHELKSSKRFYRIGNPRGNENPFLLSFGMLWFRYHNYLAKQIREKHPDYSDEKVYNEARILNIATYQKIVMYDWLPVYLGDCPNSAPNCRQISNYTGYKSSVHPGITHIFQSAAMRFGHTLVPPGVFRRSGYDNVTGTCTFYNTTTRTAGDSHSFREEHIGRNGLRTCNSYWNPTEAISESFTNDKNDGLSELLMGMASQICEADDNIITPDLRGSVFGPLQFSRRDLMALNIQRGRDHGLADYNTARQAFGLVRRNTFKDVNPDLFDDEDRNGPELLRKFIRVHDGNLENVDIWTGGLLETTKNGPGELFREVILDQFERIRDSDRFWFENRANGHLTGEEYDMVDSTTMKDVILRTNPDMTEYDIQNNPFVWSERDSTALCPQPYALRDADMENCTEPKGFDYFTGSEISFAVSWGILGLYVILMILLLLLLGKISMKNKRTSRIRSDKKKNTDGAIVAEEILGKFGRQIQILFGPGKVIETKSAKGAMLRVIDLTRDQSISLLMSNNGSGTILVCHFTLETYDLILSFDGPVQRDHFVTSLKKFFAEEGIHLGLHTLMKEKLLWQQARTKEKRDRKLKKFFAEFAKIFEDGQAGTLERICNPIETRKYAGIKLSREEFAEYLKLKPDSMFLDQTFEIADKNGDGFISYREFMEVIWIFKKGTPESRARMMFRMYDIEGTGTLTMDNFKLMVRSTLEMVNTDIDDAEIDTLAQKIVQQYGFEDRNQLNLTDFQKIMAHFSDAEDLSIFNSDEGRKQRVNTVLHMSNDAMHRRETKLDRARRTIRKYTEEPIEMSETNAQQSIPAMEIGVQKHREEPATKFERNMITIEKYLRNYRMHIYWLIMYTLVAWAVFAERVYYYSVEREHGGLRRICGYGVSFTRGAASGMMFTYSSLLVTMSRNTITFLRETFLHRYIPFDSAVSMHRLIAWQAMIFTIIHIMGHTFNFYSVATQPTSDLMCLFPDYWRTSDELPKFHYWAWQTITGVTGILSTLVVIMMFVFASDYSRHLVFRWFWNTHMIGHILLFILMVLHGSGFFVQRPFFYYFFLGPVVLYTLDKLYSVSRNKNEISVIKAELLPSNVLHLEFKRPPTFDYRAGQWVRIACLAQSPNEYHPFTLTSAPHEDTLKLHIRAVGPWTKNLRNIYDPDRLRDNPYPKIFLDGPFGEGHQDWYKYEVSVLIGGGIGVTPFASILKDLVRKTNGNQSVRCKKVFFMWLTRDQKEFEWLTDTIQKTERADTKGILEPHIFVTQVPTKYDFRTIILHICERNFHRISGRSLFTGLRAITHFGRPNFPDFFTALANKYTKIDKFGVFSCGPLQMTQNVDEACSEMNKIEGATFLHHFENF